MTIMDGGLSSPYAPRGTGGPKSNIHALYDNQSVIVRWNGSHTKPFFTEKGAREGCILSTLLFSPYTEQLTREADITESGAVTGGRSITNLRYADDTALCDKSPQEINNIVHKGNYVSHYCRCISIRCTR